MQNTSPNPNQVTPDGVQMTGNIVNSPIFSHSNYFVSISFQNVNQVAPEGMTVS